MAPASTTPAKTVKPTKEPKEKKPAKPPPKPAGVDIRTFFGKPSQVRAQNASSQPKASVKIEQKDTPAKRKKNVVSDDDDESPPNKKVAAGPSKSAKTPLFIQDTDSEDEKPPKKAPPKPRVSTSKKAAMVVSSDDEDVKPKKSSPKKAPAKKAKKEDEDFEMDVDDGDEKPKPKAKPRASTSKAKIIVSDDEDEEPKAKAKAKAKPRASTSKAKIVVSDDEDDVKPAKEAAPSKPKANWAAVQAARASGPAAPGSKAIPDGAPNCLAGLTFVFTGELSSLGREEAQDLAKRFGGRVTGAPSGKTSYCVVGENAGPSKLAALKKIGIPTLDEDGFLNLIATREGFVGEKTAKKMKKEEEKLEADVRELEKQHRKAERAAVKASTSGAAKKVPLPSEMLWTTKYAPTELKQISGNKGNIEKLSLWLEKWQDSMKAGFKKPGKDGMNTSRAVLITGPPGIGKTTAAHLIAKTAGYTPLELNASDARSKKLIESGANISNKSLDGWLGGGEETNAAGIKVTDRTCLIMDEVDGMSAGDRGGVGALSALIKKTKIPIICIANDGRAQKLKPLQNQVYNMTFQKPTTQMVRSRIMTITKREGMNVPAAVIDQLIAGAQSDIRQILNMLSTWKLSSDTMDFDESKILTKMNEKYSVMTPFNIITKVLGPHMFSRTNRETLNDKMEYYFHDHSFVPLFMQENYLKSTPTCLLNAPHDPDREMKHIELIEKAARSLSDGDLVDAMIHGNDQHWSLMPLHAVVSTIRPASYMAGQGAHWGGQNGISFPAWLGNNSKENKLRRQLAEVQIKMRLQSSGSKAEVRLGYLPALHQALVRPLVKQGTSAIPDILEGMDSYYLNREDWDTIVELGVDDLAEANTIKKLTTATKTAFTKAYNGSDHPVAFHKQDFGKAPKKIAAAHGPAPDLEDVFDVDDDEAAVQEEKEQVSDDDDVGKDKLIKQSKVKGAAKAKATKAKK
ncbi:DNA replication factor C, large subunit [Exidia glandulosa HHB12029]|uniref:Replication factor C subunit 1 n=1 Tax=Exidia glandulosa HHB12029 TaxID=1314781 RepID=A0A165EMA3_EXIGL|nr:DNA replication factor C, large subunit [Exidia glandulosa HHB12029]